MKRDVLEKFLNGYLRASLLPDKTINGLQVEGCSEIKKIAFSVSYSIDVAGKAIENGADTIIVHHGILWQEIKPITSVFKKRIDILLRNNMNLFAYHIPLDIHPFIGNNISLLKLLEAKPIKKFAKYLGIEIGIIGTFKNEKRLSEIKDTLKRKISDRIICLEYGRKNIKTIGVISGGGDGYFEEAIKNGCDLYITGETNETNFEMAREYSSNFISLGHYRSEIYGIKNLESLVKRKFRIDTVFIDTGNPL